MNLEQLTEFFKWMTIINVGLLVFSSITVMLLKDMMSRMHTKMFGVNKEQVRITAYGYIGMFKVLVIVFNIVPYIALLLIR